MNEHGHHDRVDEVIEEIDALTADAASWSATGEPAHPWWVKPSPGAMTAVELTMTGPGPIAISATDPYTAIADRIGDPFVDRISHLRRVSFWVGGNSVAHQPLNVGATKFLHHLLADVRDGHYIASDTERDHARVLLAAGTLPEIHGHCLITGVADDDDTPAPLGENFQSWFTHLLDQLAQIRAEALTEAVVRALGLPPELRDRIAVVSLG
ncbi:hypothetical protein GCM10027258_80380 [Amycolatopsis stemonae]